MTLTQEQPDSPDSLGAKLYGSLKTSLWFHLDQRTQHGLGGAGFIYFSLLGTLYDTLMNLEINLLEDADVDTP